MFGFQVFANFATVFQESRSFNVKVNYSTVTK